MGISRRCQRPRMGEDFRKHGGVVTLAETHFSEDMEPERATSYSQTGTHIGGISKSNLPIKRLTQNLSCLQKSRDKDAVTPKEIAKH